MSSATREPKPFNMDRIKPMQGFAAAVDESKLANVQLKLEQGATVTTSHRRAFEVLDKSYRTVQQLSRLPKASEAIHCILTGAYALADFIPAIIELSGRQRIDALRVATLGFSKKNVGDLMALVDAELIGDISVLCSHYFSAADAEIHTYMVEAFSAHGFKVVAMRTHESSANLRSSHNVEQATIFNDRALYQFHARWIDDLIRRGNSTAAAKPTSAPQGGKMHP